MKSLVHEVDLLPEALRLRANARVSASRNIGYAVLALVIVITTTTHSHVLKSRSVTSLHHLTNQSAQLAHNEARAGAMLDRLDELQRTIDRHHKVELPVEISRVVATIVDSMPESAALERIMIDADQLQRGTLSRSVGRTPPARALVAEVAGFARSDLDVADFVANLDRSPPLADVSLDFSRQGAVRETAAREFRLSFLIDFTRRYEVEDPPQRGASLDVD